MQNHKTLHNDVLGHIDNNDTEKSILEGWCFHLTKGILPLRLQSTTQTFDVEVKEREDVSDFYRSKSLVKSGWSVKIPLESELTIEMNIDSHWTPIFRYNTTEFRDYTLPTFVVVDNFYKNPDKIREFALKQNFQENPQYHKGKRSINPEFRFPGLKEQFEKILNRKIKDWHRYAVNGCFQYCIAGEAAVYHHDIQQYAGVLYLTPDAPPNTGTCFYRSKNTKKMKMGENEYASVFKTGHYDSTQFDKVDVVGNVYNRLVLFDAQLIHAAPTYFGDNLQNGRLFQLFFFDIE
jgi:hypothetical protein